MDSINQDLPIPPSDTGNTRRYVGDHEKKNGFIEKREMLTSVTIGDEDHIVIRVENSEKEDSGLVSGESLNNGDNSNSEEGGANGMTYQSNKENEEDNNDDDNGSKLKGKFIVYEKKEDEGEDPNGSEIVVDSNGVEKGLTLVVCKPDLSNGMSGNDISQVSTTNQNQIGDQQQLRDNKISHDENNENENHKTDQQVIDSVKEITEYSQEKNDNEDVSSTKRIIERNVSPTNNNNTNNNSDRRDNGEIPCSDRYQAHSRKSIKHVKNRPRVQDTVHEIDEASESVMSYSFKRSSSRERNGDIERAINPDKGKHRNKNTETKNYPIKEDLHVNFSQTKKSVSNQTGSSLSRPPSGCPDISISRLRAVPRNEEKINPNTNKCGKFYPPVPDIPTANVPGNVTESRLSFDSTCTSSTTPTTMGTPRSVRQSGGFASNIYQQRFNKLELRKALPRKSFFNCHEKAMKDAGLVVEDAVTKMKAERLKAKLDRIAREFDPVPSRNTVRETEKDITTGVSILVTNAQDSESNNENDEETNPEDRIESNDVNSLDAIDGKIKGDFSSSVSHHGTTKKKRLHPEKTDYVECKPLVHYLEYVKDNHTEFEHHRQVSSANIKNKPISKLISLGRAFELRHRGGSPKTKDDDVIVMAAKALRPRTSDASKYYKIDQDKSGGYRGQDNNIMSISRQTRPPSDDKRRQEKNSSHANATKDEDHAKSELEKKKIRAEEWAMSVSTNTLTKAKIQSLRELGTDDDELTKWWITLRRCHYLRLNGLPESS